jgi:hypothetical protein
LIAPFLPLLSICVYCENLSNAGSFFSIFNLNQLTPNKVTR